MADDEPVDPGRQADGPPLRRCLTAVATGGALGALGRYGLNVAFPAGADRFPWTTFGINVLGCVLIGLLMAVLARRPAADPLIRLFLGTGVLGGFTTFSTYALETGELAVGGHPGIALGYLAGTLAAALAAVVLGELLGARLPAPRRGTR